MWRLANSPWAVVGFRAICRGGAAWTAGRKSMKTELYMNMNNLRKPISTGWLWVIGVGLVSVLWAGTLVFVLYPEPTWRGWAAGVSFGDMFGALNVLFSGFAFVAVVITVYLQSRSLRETQRQVYERNFEDRFFQLTRTHSGIIDGMVITRKLHGRQVTLSGRQIFPVLYEEFCKKFNAIWEEDREADQLAVIRAAYDEFFTGSQSELGHYFRNLYSIVAFVDRSSITNKRDYTKLLRAQMSSYELLLLFYNCLGTFGVKKFKTLVEKYNLLEHMPKNGLISDKPGSGINHWEEYDPSAFKETELPSRSETCVGGPVS